MGIFSSPSIAADLSFLLVYAAASLSIGFFFGRFKLVSILINIYIALAFLGVLPAELFASSVYAKAAVFVLLVIFLTAVDERLFDLHISSAGTDFFWRLFVMSLLVTGLLVSVLFSLLPKTVVLHSVSPLVYGYFGTSGALLAWLIIPLAALLFINRRLR